MNTQQRAFTERKIAQMRSAKVRRVMSSWSEGVRYDKHLRHLDQYAVSQYTRRRLCASFTTWRSHFVSAKHRESKQQLKDMMKGMQRLLAEQTDKMETLEYERNEVGYMQHIDAF